MPITSKVVSSNPAHDEVYSIHYILILAVICDRPVDFSTNKTDRHDITEKLLKLVLNTITPITTYTNVLTVNLLGIEYTSS
jgi:hypothetical protein